MAVFLIALIKEFKVNYISICFLKLKKILFNDTKLAGVNTKWLIYQKEAKVRSPPSLKDSTIPRKVCNSMIIRKL